MIIIVTNKAIEDDCYDNGKTYSKTIKELILMEINMKQDEKFDSMTIEVNTPDGIAYYTICHDENNIPIKVISTFGKAGSALAAWAFAVDILVNMLLEQRVDINDIIMNLSQISGNKPMQHLSTGAKVESGPAGLVIAFLEYKRQKYREMHLKLLQDEN